MKASERGVCTKNMGEDDDDNDDEDDEDDDGKTQLS